MLHSNNLDATAASMDLIGAQIRAIAAEIEYDPSTEEAVSPEVAPKVTELRLPIVESFYDES